MTNEKLARIRRLVGAVKKEDLRYVDCFVGDTVSLFMPVGGVCFYAVTPEHRHPSYMFTLNFDDRTSVALGGRTVTGSHGTVFALAPGVPHQELPSITPPRYVCIMIDPRLFETQYRLYSRATKPLFRGELFPAGDELLPLLRRFMIESDSGMPGAGVVRDALGVQICHSLIRSFRRTPAPRERMAERIEVSRVIEYLHGHLGGKVTVEILAKVARLSPSHFARVFRKETGRPPMEYVQGLRLERAKKLLLAADKSIADVALECGFGSSSYLSACFHQRFKITPREYQQGMVAARERTVKREGAGCARRRSSEIGRAG